MSCGKKQTGKLTLFYDDFKSGFNPADPASNYQYFTAGPFVGNDAAGGVTAVEGLLTVSSTPFTSTQPNGLDHVKYLVYQKLPYNAPRDGAELVYEGIVSVQQTGLTNIPSVLQSQSPSDITGVNNANSDIRLCSAALNCIDLQTMMVFDFILSNEDIYAFYERLPFNRTEWGGPGPNYIAFSHAIPVAKRNTADPTNDFVKLAIAYNYRDNYVRWLVNDEEVYRVNRLGYPLERKYRVLEHNVPGQVSAPASIQRVGQLQFGFGTFSLMDMYNPQNPGQVNNAALVDLSLSGVLPAASPLITSLSGLPVAPTFLSGYPVAGATGTNFGQGSILKVKYITVYVQAEDKEDRLFPCLKVCKETVLESRCEQNAIAGVNSDSSLLWYKVKGHIENCDECAPVPPVVLPPKKDCCDKKEKKCPKYEAHTLLA